MGKPAAPLPPTQLIIFTDLDGSLLDPITYSWAAAHEALEALRRDKIPLVLVSSKTRAEIESLRIDLRHHHPFITENGGAIFIPTGYFSKTPVQGRLKDGLEVIELGTPYETLRTALREIERAVGTSLRGFRDMSLEEVADRTGLGRAEAELAMEREYDEPFLFEGPSTLLAAIQQEAKEHGLTVTRGGRFHHLMGESDKGRACLHVLNRYRQEGQESPKPIWSAAIGDSANDLPMLRIVDQPIAVQLQDGSYDPGLHLSNLHRAPGVGPIGWNHAILDLLARASQTTPAKTARNTRR